MNWKHYLPIALGIFWLACSPQAPVSEPEFTDKISVKCIQPVRLKPDTSLIYLDDYLPGGAPFSVRYEGRELPCDSGVLVFTEDAPAGLSVLHVSGKTGSVDLPLIRSRKEKVLIQTAALPNAGNVALAGSFNGWNPKAHVLEFNGTAWQTELLLDPGMHSYQLVVDEVWMTDPSNELKQDNNMGAWNSVIRVGPEDQERLHFDAVELQDDSIFLTAGEGESIALWWDNTLLTEVKGNGAAKTALAEAIPQRAKKHLRSHLRAWVFDSSRVGKDLFIPLDRGKAITRTEQLQRGDHHRWNLYFVLIDRFADGDSSNNNPLDDPEVLPIANHFGGDFAGLMQQLENGYFEQLGSNAIWVSPITENAEGAWGLWDKGIRSKFSGYHGYWPISSSKLNPHFGDSTLFAELIEALHARDMAILVDYVANHVHEEHPVYQQHPDWATDLYLPDGRMNTELWDEQRLTTWFDTFLPTLDLERREVADAMTDSALHWVKNFQIDGFRHDATKHIPDAFWRMLTSKVNAATADDPTRNTLFQIGETYGNPELISGYIGAGLLDAQFDFNLYDAAVDAFAKSESGFANLERVLLESLSFYGSHHLMGNISGNQDRARFISYADGSLSFDEDPKLAGWTREIEHKDPVGFDRLAMLHAFNLTVPGVPCLYYGDEIGLPGGNDPDNRRMMRFNGLTEEEQKLRDTFSALSKLRSERMSLLYGQFKVLHRDAHTFVYERRYLDESSIVVFSKKEQAVKLAELGISASILSASNASLDGQELHFSGEGFALLNGTLNALPQ